METTKFGVKSVWCGEVGNTLINGESFKEFEIFINIKFILAL